MYSTKEIKESFLEYFVDHKHLNIPNKGLIPNNQDASTLFINSGVHAIKPYILGQETPPAKRLTSNQSCIRTIDIDRVGKNVRTLTYFNMLGSWSIGDYWKEEGLTYAFDLLTNKLGLEKNNFAVTLFAGDEQIPRDEESANIWRSLGIKENQLYFKSAEDNLWSMGATGPCGPCTEVYIDRGEKYGKDSIPGDESPRFVEIWNAGVFMTYLRTEKNELLPLKPRVIDTGAGLERLAVILQNKESVYDVHPLDKIGEIIRSNITQSTNAELYTRIISDHLRASIFVANEGVVPSNKLQGYVLRRLLRKSIYSSELLGITNFSNMVSDVLTVLNEDATLTNSNVKTIINNEYNSFRQTLLKGRKKLDELLSKTGSERILSGSDVFRLYDTYGFPAELTRDIAELSDVTVRFDEFEKAVVAHKAISKTNANVKFKSGLSEATPITTQYHTATHLIHKALTDILREEIPQAGSNITEERLRFDFKYSSALNPDQISSIEDIVNKKISEGLPVTKKTMSYDDAKLDGALSLYEKQQYPEGVNVYFIGDYSMEVCDGPHVQNTSEIGKIQIFKEQSSGKGVRRIYAKIVKEK